MNARDDINALPLVYSCSGCSNVAQLANRIALWLDREGIAEMSCIAGVGGGVPSIVRTARAGRFIIALDGCPLHCTRGCLAREGVQPRLHVTLSESGLRKRYGEECDDDDFVAARRLVVDRLRQRQES